MVDISDADLLAMFEHPEKRERAFSCIVDKYAKRIYWIVRKIVISHHDADDIVQDVLVKLWTQLPNFRGDSSIFTWIYKIAVNQAISTIRSRSKERYAIVQTPAEEFERIVASECLFDGDEIQKQLEIAINRLPEKQKAVFVLRYYDEMPFKEMSEILETSEGALKASYHIAREKIESQIKLFVDSDV